MHCVFVCVAVVAASLPAQRPKAPPPPPPPPAELVALQDWHNAYKSGAFRLTAHDADDPEALAVVERTLGAAAGLASQDAAQALFAVASTLPEPPATRTATEAVTFHRELQPWRVQALAIRYLASMQWDGLDGWLVEKLGAALRDPTSSRELETSAVLRAIAARDGRGPGLPMLLQACQALPKEQRAKALHALSQVATAETVPAFLGALRDAEPNVRIAALNALGRAVSPLVDETRTIAPDTDNAALRERVVAAMQAVLVRDLVWQVRVAAAENLAALKTKAAIPALIAGLEAELGRKKDPWALDLRIHRLLEGLTGQKVLPNQVDAWKQFWRDEGAAFALTADAEMAAKSAQRAEAGGRQYGKFFHLDIESDRLLFVVDFSGSMREPVTVPIPGTSAGGAVTMTKAELVVRELERLVTALPNGTLFNLIVFSEQVRVWRSDANGRPALVALDDAARDDLLGSYLRRLQPAGATDLWSALELALDMQGRGLYDKNYALGFDTLYVMSDGAPTWGKITDTDEILRRVREANALRRLAIHTVTFGDRNEMRFLQAMARENSGRHIHVE